MRFLKENDSWESLARMALVSPAPAPIHTTSVRVVFSSPCLLQHTFNKEVARTKSALWNRGTLLRIGAMFPTARNMAGPRHPRLRSLGLICVLAAGPVSATQLIPDLQVPDSLMVGDLFHLSLSVVAPAGSQVVPPAEESFGKATVREWNTSRNETAGGDSSVFSYVLTTYIPETCTIPPLQLLVIQDDVIDTLTTDTLMVPLYSAIPAESVDSTLDIKDLRDPFSAGTPSLWWLWALCALVVLAVGGWLLYRWLEGRRAGPGVAPLPPPYEEAMESLRELELRNLVRQGQVQQHVFCLSEILKRYIERRFAVNAQEFTTEEIMLWLRASAVPREVRLYAEKFFADSDPVKYAKWLPEDSTLHGMSKQVRSFVSETRPRSESQAAATPESAADTDQRAEQEQPHDT